MRSWSWKSGVRSFQAEWNTSTKSLRWEWAWSVWKRKIKLVNGSSTIVCRKWPDCGGQDTGFRFYSGRFSAGHCMKKKLWQSVDWGGAPRPSHSFYIGLNSAAAMSPSHWHLTAALFSWELPLAERNQSPSQELPVSDDFFPPLEVQPPANDWLTGDTIISLLASRRGNSWWHVPHSVVCFPFQAGARPQLKTGQASSSTVCCFPHSLPAFT